MVRWTREERLQQIRQGQARGLTRKQIADELGVTPSAVNEILWDPDGSKARARKDRYRGVCRVCGKPTDGSNGRAHAPVLCAAHHRQAQHDRRYWTPERITGAFREYARITGRSPVSAFQRTPSPSPLPHPRVVSREFSSWPDALNAAGLTPRGGGKYERTPETLEKLSRSKKQQAARKHAALLAELLSRLPGEFTVKDVMKARHVRYDQAQRWTRTLVEGRHATLVSPSRAVPGRCGTASAVYRLS